MSRDSDDHSKGSNTVSSPARTPTPPDGDALLQTKREGSTPTPKVHREPHSAQVKTK
jgi:hypothetical protein